VPVAQRPLDLAFNEIGGAGRSCVLAASVQHVKPMWADDREEHVGLLTAFPDPVFPVDPGLLLDVEVDRLGPVPLHEPVVKQLRVTGGVLAPVIDEYAPRPGCRVR
jgi:hypothetical protein